MATTGQVRRLVIGVATGLTVTLSLLGPGAQDASAQPIRVKEQREFVSTCRSLGGTSQSTGPRTVQCTYPNGAQMECNFNTDQCTSHLGKTSGDRKPTGGRPAGGVVVEEVAAGDTGVEDNQGQDSGEAGAMSPIE